MADTNYMTQAQYPALYLYGAFTDEWIPYAASSYTWVDKYTLQAKIKDEAKWWDGTPITADDVKYTWELGKRMFVPFTSPFWDYLESVDVIDAKTIQFTTSEAKLNYFQLLGVLQQIILPKARWEPLEAQYGSKLTTDFKDDVPANILGAGPYKAYQVGEGIFYYIRVDNWWGASTFGLPNPKYVAIKIPKDNAQVALAFEQGELDMMTHMTPKIWEMWEVKGLPVRTYYSHPPYYVGGGVNFVWMNFKTKGLDNVVVRRAIAYSLNMSDMIIKAYYNYGAIAMSVPILYSTSAAKYINQSLISKYGWTFDIDKANKILDDAGITRGADGIRVLPDGTRLGPYTIEVPYGWTDWMMMIDIMASNLQKIGIDAQSSYPDFSVWWQHLTDKNWNIVIGWADANPGYAHPWNAFRSTMDPRLAHPAGNWENYPGTSEVSALIDAIPLETDSVKIQAMYNRLQELWLTEIPGIPFFFGATWYEYSTKYWVGWPNEENKFWFTGMFWGGPPNALPTFFRIVPVGQTPKDVAWVTNTKFGSSKIFADLAAAPVHGLLTKTVTVTTTSVSTVVQATTVTATTTTQVPTMDMTSVAGAGIVAIVIGVAVGWLLGSRKKQT